MKIKEKWFKSNKKNKFNKKYAISIALVIIMVIGGITPVITKANINAEPVFDIEMDVNPNPAIAGQNVLVSGTITPQPFEIDIPAKEIVLVLDVSGSMSTTISNITCSNMEGWCSDHKKYGGHTYNSTRIAELKKAANNFIDKMQDVENLKISIVTYSSDGLIKRSNNKALIDSSQVSILKNIINGLSANGGTNTGEGLRRATYLLSSSTEQNSKANKTVVLMSDGIPTYYTRVDKNNNNYYLDVTKESGGNSYNSGSGNSDTTDLKDLGYAKAIGDIVREKGYNAFTIGYGMDSVGIQRMSQIHESMTGKNMSDTSTSNEDKGFFPTEGDAIDSVFDQIANAILDYVDVKDINVSFNNPNFTLDIGGNTVELANITYERDKTFNSNTKIRYAAEPVSFSFTIKGNTAGYYEDIFADSNLNYKWNNELKNIALPEIDMELEDNTLPNIKAILQNPQIGPLEELTSTGEEVRYTINPEEFEFDSSDDGNGPKDIVILIDISNEMGNGNRLTNVLNGIDNQIVNRFATGKEDNIAFVVYSNEAIVISEDGNGNPFSNNQGYLHNKIVEMHSTPKNEGRNIDKALLKADEILNSEYANPDASKNIVIIAGGEVITNGLDTSEIEVKGYNIISAELQSERNQSIQSLVELHGQLGGTTDKYFSSIPDGGNYNDLDSVMKNVADKISASRVSVYRFKDVKLRFDTGKNITAIEEVVIRKGDTLLEGSIKSSGQVVEINLPTIEYRYNAGKYKAESFEVIFKVVPNKTGRLNFEKNESTNIKNYIEYTKINKTKPQISIQTPTIIVNNNLPFIKATLLTGEDKLIEDVNRKVIYSSVGGDISISYMIEPQKFDYDQYQGVEKDIVVLLDTTTANQGNGNEWEKIKSSFNRIIIDEFMDRENVNVAMVSFNKNGEAIDLTSGLTNDIQVVKNCINNLEATGEGEGNIVNSLKLANEMLSTLDSANKSIVMITLGDIADYGDDGQFENIKNKEYNIFTAMIPKDAENEVNAKSIFDYLHIEDNYSELDYINNGGNNGNELHTRIMENLKNRLNTKINNEYIVDDAVLRFDLPNGFEVVDGLEINNSYELHLPKIKYTKGSEEGIEIMQANSFEVSFTIRNETVGEYDFGEVNTLSYTGMDSISKLLFNLDTPRIVIGEINHGIYLGQGNIHEANTNNSFAKGSVIQMAAKFEVNGNGEKIGLNIDNILDVEGIPKVYKLSDSGQLTYLKDMEQERSSNNEEIENKFSTTLVGSQESGKMIVLYSVKLPDIIPSYNNNNILNYTNIFNLNNNEKPYTIKILDEILPDLF